MSGKIEAVLVTFLLLVCSAIPVLGQAGLGSITGIVVDRSGASVPGATLRLVEADSQTARSTSSNEAGLFSFPSLMVGRYRLTIAASGFKTRELDNLTVNAFQQLSLGQVLMEVGEGPASVVTVTAEQQLVKDSAARFETIQARQVEDIPLNGRSWPTLLKIIPGANPTSQGVNGREYSAGAPFVDFRINGKAANQTQVNLDGGNIVDHGTDTRTSVAPSLESVQEISVLTNNFQAEYGTRGGAVINIVTRSGSNEFHGSVFDYLRNEALNANTWEGSYLGRPRQRYRFNYFGANIGGPVRKNKLFFFYNIENFKQDTPSATLLSRVPTLQERNGDFSQTRNADGSRPIVYTPGSQFTGTPLPLPNNAVPASMIHPLGKAILNVFPEANNPSNPTQNHVLQYVGANPRRTHTGKVDWNVNDNTRAYIRYTEDQGTLIDRNFGGNVSGNLPFSAVLRPRPDRALSAGATRTFSPTVVMESLLAWSYDFVEWLPAEPEKVTRAAHGLSNLPTVFKPQADILPGVDTGVYPAWSFNRMPQAAKANDWQFSTTLSWTRGKHLIKFGGQYVRSRKDSTDVSVDKGAYDFRPSAGSAFDTGYGPANVLVGSVSTFQQVENLSRTDSLYKDYHFFIQDTWKIKRNLTFDFGVRLYHIPSEYNMDPRSTLDAVFLPSRWDPAKAPRYYVPNPRSPSQVIDPANPNNPAPSAAANVLRFSLVPGSGDPLNGVVPLGQGGLGKAGIPDPRFLLFAPRGGFAWSPRGSDSTVIRGGFGWSYNRNGLSDTVLRFQNALGNTANLAQTSFETMAATSTVRRIAARGFGARDEAGGAIPTIYDYSLSLQRQLPGNLVVDIAYIGNLQRHQPVNFNLNAIPLGTALRPEYVDPRSAGYNFAGPISAANPGPALPGSNAIDPLLMRPYLGLDALTMTANVANNAYHSMQASVNKRFGSGLSLQAAYTLARTTTQQENAGLFSYNWKDYTGYKLNTDRRHVLSVNYSYDVPKLAETLRLNNAFGRRALDGWSVAHLFMGFSGQDFSPTFAVQQANTAANVDLPRIFLGTPDLTPRVVLAGDPNALSKTLAQQFDASKLGVPAIFPQADGTGPRNFLSGRGSFANDFSVTKAIPIDEKRGFELRANFYNAFNQVRRLGVNGMVQFKANGRALADGFSVFNTPDAVAARVAANTNPVQRYNQYRQGVGHVNLTSVEPMRIIEVALKFRF